MNNSLKKSGIIEEILPVEDLLNEELALIKGGAGTVDPPAAGCSNGNGCSNGKGCKSGGNITNELEAW